MAAEPKLLMGDENPYIEYGHFCLAFDTDFQDALIPKGQVIIAGCCPSEAIPSEDLVRHWIEGQIKSVFSGLVVLQVRKPSGELISQTPFGPNGYMYLSVVGLKEGVAYPLEMVCLQE